MPKHAFNGIDVSAAAGLRGAEIMQKPIGTGPFRLKEWRKGSHIILESNPDYWDKGRPCLDQVVLRVLPDGAARAIAVETGEVDLSPMSGLPEAEIQRLSKLPQTRRVARRQPRPSAQTCGWKSTCARSRSPTCKCVRRSAWRSTASGSST